MGQQPWRDADVRHERAIRSVAMLFCLIVAATMFFSLTALTGDGADYDCGPAAFALLAGPADQAADVADCRRAAGQRLTTVSGLVILATFGAAVGPRLLAAPATVRSPTDPSPDLPSDGRVRHPRPARRRRPFSDAIG
jgi:hypothetical protein